MRDKKPRNTMTTMKIQFTNGLHFPTPLPDLNLLLSSQPIKHM